MTFLVCKKQQKEVKLLLERSQWVCGNSLRVSSWTFFSVWSCLLIHEAQNLTNTWLHPQLRPHGALAVPEWLLQVIRVLLHVSLSGKHQLVSLGWTIFGWQADEARLSAAAWKHFICGCQEFRRDSELLWWIFNSFNTSSTQTCQPSAAMLDHAGVKELEARRVLDCLRSCEVKRLSGSLILILNPPQDRDLMKSVEFLIRKKESIKYTNMFSFLLVFEPQTQMWTHLLQMWRWNPAVCVFKVVRCQIYVVHFQKSALNTQKKCLFVENNIWGSVCVWLVWRVLNTISRKKQVSLQVCSDALLSWNWTDGYQTINICCQSSDQYVCQKPVCCWWGWLGFTERTFSWAESVRPGCWTHWSWIRLKFGTVTVSGLDLGSEASGASLCCALIDLWQEHGLTLMIVPDSEQRAELSSSPAALRDR